MVSVVNITRSSDPDAVPSRTNEGKSYPASCVAGRSQGSLCCMCVCVKLVGPIWVSEDAHINDGLCHYSVAFNLIIFVCKTPATVLGEKILLFNQG